VEGAVTTAVAMDTEVVATFSNRKMAPVVDMAEVVVAAVDGVDHLNITEDLTDPQHMEVDTEVVTVVVARLPLPLLIPVDGVRLLLSRAPILATGDKWLLNKRLFNPLEAMVHLLLHPPTEAVMEALTVLPLVHLRHNRTEHLRLPPRRTVRRARMAVDTPMSRPATVHQELQAPTMVMEVATAAPRRPVQSPAAPPMATTRTDAKLTDEKQWAWSHILFTRTFMDTKMIIGLCTRLSFFCGRYIGSTV